MCTLIVAWRTFEDVPIVAAANRDEAFDRPADPPAVREHAGVRYVAPLDRRAGGTWIGYSEHDVFAGLTNRWVESGPIGGPSRGLLVRDALVQPSAEAAANLVEREVLTADYASFNLVVADGETAHLFEWDGTLRVTALEPGIHVVVNVGADGAFEIPRGRQEPGERQARGARRAGEILEPAESETVDEWLERARRLLADHDAGFCVHGDGFGTRSSSLLTVDADRELSFSFADGPPCEVDHEPVDAVL